MSDIDNPIEQYLHIAEMKAELNELSDGMMEMHTSENIDQDLEESFLRNVLAYENAEQIPLRIVLERDGMVLPIPSDLNDAQVSLKLDELIQAMAKRRHYLGCTDHLSDRELYERLANISMEETVPDLPSSDHGYYFLDITGSGSDEDVEIYLRYYADEDWRSDWAEEFPDMVIPPHEDPPYDRDRSLPKPPPPPDPYDDPEVAAKWCAKYHNQLLLQLADAGIIHGNINSEPVAYAPPMASIWAVEGKDCNGTVEWWALNGECPFIFISAKEVPNPRDFLHLASQQLNAEVEALEAARKLAEEAVGSCFKRQPFYMQLRYADTLERWAADDRAWDDE